MYFHIINMSFYLLLLSLITINGLKIIDVTHAAQELHQEDNQSLIQNLIMQNNESQQEAKVSGKLQFTLQLSHVFTCIIERLLYFDMDSMFGRSQYSQGILSNLSSGLLAVCSIGFGIKAYLL